MENTIEFCYAAYIDILGFKNILSENNNIEDIRSIFKDICENKLENAIFFEDENENIPLKNVRKHVMSDSIVMYIDGTLDNSLLALLKQCQFTAVRLIKCEKPSPILVRGAIATGYMYDELINKHRIVFGEALVKAYLMAEKTARYPRIIMSDQTLEKGMANIYPSGWKEELLSEDFADKFTYIRYLNRVVDDDEGRNRMTEFVKKQLATICDSHIREKYLYLQREIEREIKNSDGKS